MRKPDGWRFIAGASVIAILTVTQTASATVPSRSYTVAHQLVDVDGGRRLNLFCLGQGRPVVLFEAGLGGTTMTWRHVQDGVATFTRACSYDRAGYGFSDPANRPSDASNAADDLHRLIGASGLATPLVLAAHSEGGLYDVVYALRHPADVAGLVLVDPRFAEFGRQTYRQESPDKQAKQVAGSKFIVSAQRKCLALATAGDLQKLAMQGSDCLRDFEELDPVLEKEWHRQAALVPYNAANLSEWQSVAAKDADAASLDDDEMPSAPARLDGTIIRILVEQPDHPFPGFSSTEMASVMKIDLGDAETLAARSDRGSVEQVSHASHFIQDDRPDIVVETIRSVVDQIRRKP